MAKRSSKKRRSIKVLGEKGKVALVTGAASGLGVTLAEPMAEAGADVVCADINSEGLEKTVKKFEKIGQKGLAVICDVSKEEDVKRMMKVAVDTFGRIYKVRT